MHVSLPRLERFDPATERRYAADLTERMMPVGRLAAAVGAVVVLVLGVWDHLLDPGALGDTLPIRIVVAAVFLVALLASYTEPGSRSLSPYMLVHVTVGLAFPLLLAQLPDGFVAGVPGMVLPMIVVPILSVRSWHAATALASLVALPNIVMFLAGATRFEIVQANWWLVPGALVAGMLFWIMAVDRRRAFAAAEALAAEERRSAELLLNILPAEIVERLKIAGGTTSDAFDDATVLFADIAGFTDFAESVGAKELVGFLNELFAVFDDVVVDHGLEKIKTIGDAYMAVGGVPSPRRDHALMAVDAAREMQRAFELVCLRHDVDLGLRIGLHSGPLVGGVIGKRKYSYDVWGDTVNVASRMESSGVPGRIRLSVATRNHLDDRYPLESCGAVELRHHTPVEAFVLV